MKLPEGMKRGWFEAAYPAPACYLPVSAYLIGSFAVHKMPDREWRLSHRATGMAVPGAYAKSLRDAADLAKRLDAAADWSKVRRTKTVGVVSGLTRARVKAARQVLGLDDSARGRAS